MYTKPEEKPFWPARWWWVALLFILVIAGALRSTGYNFSLPYIDHPDEPNYMLAAQMKLDNGTARSLGMDGYPPGIITINYFILRWLHDPASSPLSIAGSVRILTVIASTSTVLLTAFIGYQMDSPLAGLFAAALMAMAPEIVMRSSWATADPYVTFFSALAIFLTLIATRYDHNRYAIWGVLALLLGILFKYQAIALAPIIIGLPLLRLLWVPPQKRHRIWINFIETSAILGVFMLWLVFIYPTIDISGRQEWAWNRHVESASLPSIATFIANLKTTLKYLSPSSIALISGLGLIIGTSGRKTQRTIWILGFTAVLIGAMLLIVAVSVFEEANIRHLMPAQPLVATLLGTGLTLWIPVIAQFLQRINQKMIIRYAYSIATVSICIIIGILLLPNIQYAAADAYNRTLPDRRNDLMVYMDTSVPPGSHMANWWNHKTLNPHWGGYSGFHDYPFIEMANFDSRTIDEWRELGTEYAIPGYPDLEALLNENPDIADEITILKTYPPDDGYRGPSMMVIRLYPIQHEFEGTLGLIKMIGYDVEQTTVSPSDSVNLTYYWQADAPTSGSHRIYNHLVPIDSREVIAQIDGPPLFDEFERRPTSMWDDPDEILMSRTFSFLIDENVLPGEYRLLTGFYNVETGQRLTTPEGDDYLQVTTITVEEE